MFPSNINNTLNNNFCSWYIAKTTWLYLSIAHIAIFLVLLCPTSNKAYLSKSWWLCKILSITISVSQHHKQHHSQSTTSVVRVHSVWLFMSTIWTWTEGCPVHGLTRSFVLFKGTNKQNHPPLVFSKGTHGICCIT